MTTNVMPFTHAQYFRLHSGMGANGFQRTPEGHHGKRHSSAACFLQESTSKLEMASKRSACSPMPFAACLFQHSTGCGTQERPSSTTFDSPRSSETDSDVPTETVSVVVSHVFVNRPCNFWRTSCVIDPSLEVVCWWLHLHQLRA